MFKYPCKQCSDRVLGCHSTCQKYKTAKLAHQRYNAKVWKQKKAEEDFYKLKKKP